MDYNKLQSGQYFECKIKCTYVEIYVFFPKKNKYYRVFSLQKRDFSGVLGYGEKTTPNANNLVPITLTDEVLYTILDKVYPNGMGALTLQFNDNSFSNGVETELKRKSDTVELFGQNVVVAPNIPDKSNNSNKVTTVSDTVYDVEYETYNNPLSKIDDGVVYVNYKAIDCDDLNEDDVEVEEIVEEIVEETKKDYSKLIWIALAAAAALL